MNGQHQPLQTITKFTVLIKSSIVGSLRSMSVLPLQHPFDALKTNMQANQANLINSAKLIYQNKGWKGFYNGFNVNLIRVMIKQAYRWPLWISTQSFYKNLLPKSYQIIRQTATGATISLCQLFIICPFQRIKVWLMTTKNQSESKMNIQDLYTGFTAQLVKQTLSWSTFLVTTQVSKNLMKQYKGSDILTPIQLFLLSIPVAIINTLFIMPIDCIKTFYQCFQDIPDKKKLSFRKTAISMIEKYGIKGLYLGWSARMIQYMIQSSYTLIAFEQLQRLYERTNKNGIQ